VHNLRSQVTAALRRINVIYLISFHSLHLPQILSRIHSHVDVITLVTQLLLTVKNVCGFGFLGKVISNIENLNYFKSSLITII
jgi:hypothetical protein